MEKHCCSTSRCHKQCHCQDCNDDHNHDSCKHCCPLECCCTCHCCRCRKDLCSADFRIRLGGLQNGLSFRLRQMICCVVEFELDNGTKVKGTIVFVGSNFVELFVDDTQPIDCKDERDIRSEKHMDKESTKKNLEEGNVLEDVSYERKHKKGRTWIFSIDKISHMTLISPCHLNNLCP